MQNLSGGTRFKCYPGPFSSVSYNEPICFNATRAIDTKYAKEHYELIRTYIEYMGFDSDSVLRMVEKPDSILKVIDGMK